MCDQEAKKIQSAKTTTEKPQSNLVTMLVLECDKYMYLQEQSKM